jgi:hypothetical protein
MTARTELFLTFTYTNIVWRGMRKSTKNIVHDSRCDGRHFNAGPPDLLCCIIYSFYE